MLLDLWTKGVGFGIGQDQFWKACLSFLLLLTNVRTVGSSSYNYCVPYNDPTSELDFLTSPKESRGQKLLAVATTSMTSEVCIRTVNACTATICIWF